MRKTILIIAMLLLTVLLAGAVAADSMLILNELEVKVDGDKDSSADELGGSFEVWPGAEVEMKIEVRNEYDKSLPDDETDIEDVEIEIVIEGIDDGDDIEIDAEIDGTVDADDEEKTTIKFDIPLRLNDEDISTMTIYIVGEDGNRTKHEINLEIDVVVEKENHELRFIQNSISKTKVEAGESVQLKTTILNTGAKDEEVIFTVDAEGLDFTYMDDEIELDEGDDDDSEYSYTGLIKVDDDVATGTYSIVVKAEFNDGRDSIEKTFELEVEKIEEVVTPTPTPTPVPVVTPTPTPTPTPEPEPVEEEVVVQVVSKPTPVTYTVPSNAAYATPVTDYSSSNSWLSKNKWIVIISVVNVLLLIVGIAIVLMILNRRRD